MTMPHERTRALIWAGEFLRDANAGKLSLEDLREQARSILRHYPSVEEINDIHVNEVRDDDFRNPLLAPVVDGKAVNEPP